jgi:hypothetical protein
MPGFAGNRKYESDTSSALEELTLQEGVAPEDKHSKSTSRFTTREAKVLVTSSWEGTVSYNQILLPQTP